jgi:putative transposase
MVQFRRNRFPGGTYFFTVTLRDRRSRALTDHIGPLREAFRTVRAARPFEVVAIVVLPEHLHTVICLPEGDADYSGRWRAIKSRFTRELRVAGIPLTRDNRGEYRLWQRRFWEHTIRDDRDYEHHVDYIHWNPVKHGLTTRVVDWPYSSFHRYVHRGLRPNDWTNGVAEPSKRYGELL